MAELPQKHRVSVSGVLKILGVSRSGYRAWKQRVPSVSEKHRVHIKDAIKQIYDGSHQNYGAPKITEMLHRQGESIAEKTVGNYMRQMGIKAQWVKPYTVTTIDSDFSSELQNILDEQFNPSRPDAVWVSDITYIWTYNGFVYLTSIMDLYSRKIIAWVLSQSLEAIYKIEEMIRNKTPGEKYEERQKQSRPVMDALFEWLHTMEDSVDRSSLIGDAILYTLNQEVYLRRYLEDGHLSIDNNSAERALKNFAVGRRNWLFAKSVRGADASALVYSITETALLNHLKPYAYLTYILDELRKMGAFPKEEELKKLLPWSEDLPEYCRTKLKK